METELKRALIAELARGGQAYIRNLAAAEQAILLGQFNVAKVLRAAAHSQRVQGMEAARLLAEEYDAQNIFNTILEEIDPDEELVLFEPMSPAVQQYLQRSAAVRERLRDIIQRALGSLENNPDVLESDVAQFLRGCYGCGAILEGDPPHACPICGALSVEFEGFGPFYSATAEHLGQLTPEAVIKILESIPDEIETTVTNVDQDVLQRKPAPGQWSIAEIIGHMLETDRFFVKRAQKLLAEQGQELPWVLPPWKLQEGKGYETMQSTELIDHMRAARTSSLALIRALTAEDWTRRGLSFGSKSVCSIWAHG
ncbi:MAG: DinB family protein [Candidatus Promineifilaceae bacterium]|nr:DinB family protein [Candidatus Promineifilaceae bacterium]